MGDHCSHDSQQSDTPIHRVCVDDFHIGIYEVSQQEYQLVIDTNPSKGEVSIEKPVNSVSWYDAERFVQKLNKMSNTKYRLPTEAEWEYAASDRGVTMTFSGGEELDRVGWYKGNSSRSSHVRGTKQPNASGLYDMTGNVSEWCSDWWNFDYYKIGSRTNPKGPDEGELKVTRGGSWVDVESLSCIHLRRSEKPETRSSTLGFRLVLPHHY